MPIIIRLVQLEPIRIEGQFRSDDHHSGLANQTELDASGWKRSTVNPDLERWYAKRAKQCALAATLAFARETPRLRFNAVEPGITPGTGLGGPNVLLGLLFRYVVTFLPPFAQYRSTPEHTARIIAAILTDESGKTGVYYDEKGRTMLGSEFAR